MRAVRQRKLCLELAPDGLGEFSAVARAPIDKHSLSSTRAPDRRVPRTRRRFGWWATTWMRPAGQPSDDGESEPPRAAQSRRCGESHSRAIHKRCRCAAEVELGHAYCGSALQRSVSGDTDHDRPHSVTPRRGTTEGVFSHPAEHVPQEYGIAAAVTANPTGDGDLLCGREVPLDGERLRRRPRPSAMTRSGRALGSTTTHDGVAVVAPVPG